MGSQRGREDGRSVSQPSPVTDESSPVGGTAAPPPPEYRDSDCCRANLRALLDRSSEGIAVHDSDGRLLEVNERLCDMLGYAREELLSMSVCDFDIDHPAEQVRAVLADLSPGGRRVLRTRHRGRDGATIPVELRLTAVATPDGRRFIGFRSDTSAQDRLAAELAGNQQRFQRLFDVNPDAMLVVRRQRITLANPAAVTLLNAADADDLTGLFIHELVPPHRAEFVRERIELLRTGRTAPLAEDETCCLDGVIKPTESIAIPFVDEAGPATLVILRDISARRAMETTVLEASDEARRVLAHDLHDDLGQRLTGLSLLADALARRLGAEGHEQTDAAVRLRDLLADTVQATRRLAHGQLPRELEDGHLGAALRDLGARLRANPLVHCRVRIRGNDAEALSASAATHLFRIAQEASTNALRHGRAGMVFIVLQCRPQFVRLIVADDGAGLATADAGGGIGLQAMSYRAHALRGTLQFARRHGGGTRVICRLPRAAAVSGTADGNSHSSRAEAG